MDPDVHCNLPLDEWVDEACATGFFSFSERRNGAVVPAEWFMASVPGSPVWSRLRADALRYAAAGRFARTRRLAGRLRRRRGSRPAATLGERVLAATDGHEVWRKCPRRSAEAPRAPERFGYRNPAPEEFRAMIRAGEPPVFYLAGGADASRLEPGSVLHELLKETLDPGPSRGREEVPPVLTDCGERPLRQVILVGSVRSGTNVFRRFLRSSGVVEDCGEVFHPHLHGRRNFYFWLSRQGPVHPHHYRRLWPFFLEYVRGEKPWALLDVKTKVFDLLRDPKTGAGWPIFPAGHPGIETLVIRLKRRNTLAQIVSYERLVRRGVVTSETSASADAPGVHLDPGETVRRIEEFRERDSVVDGLVEKPDLEIFYEDFFGPDGRFADPLVASCARLLGVEEKKFDPHPGLKKVGVGDAVANPGELAERLADTPYEWMLHGLSARD